MKHIRNSTAEFLIFTKQSGQESIEVCYEDKTIWLTQKLMGRLFDVETHTINYHLKEVLKPVKLKKIQLFENFE